MASQPQPPANAFTFYFRQCQSKITSQCLQGMAEKLLPIDPPVDARSMKLPLPFSTIVDALGESTPISEESAKACQKFLEHRLVPRHKIPNVGMRADGKFAIRAYAAREAKLLELEIVILQNPNSCKLLQSETRAAAAKNWKESVDFGSSLTHDMILKAKRDVGRYHQEMHQYYSTLHCECAKEKKCRGLLCICSCYFCNVDRAHGKVGQRCECSRPHRENKRWQGALQLKTTELTNDGDGSSKSSSSSSSSSSSQNDTVNYRNQPTTNCVCHTKRKCDVHGCDCFCGYCLREKALLVQRTERTNKEYCPCKNIAICRDSHQCFCRCYKCSCEKSLMGVCPFRPPQVV